MKKLFFSVILLLSATIFFGSCKDGENASPAGSSITLNGETRPLAKAFAQSFDPQPGGEDIFYGWALGLTGEGIVYDGDEEEFGGEGDVVLMLLSAINDDSEELPVGTYTFPYEIGKHSLSTVDVLIDFDSDVDERDSEFEQEEIESAEVTIAKSGSTYSINFTVTLEDDKKITGKYVGTITPAVLFGD